LILRNLTYCCYVGYGTSKGNLNKLFVLQKRAVRHITNSQHRAPTSTLFKSLNILKFHDNIDISISIFTFRFYHNLLPISFCNFFKHNNIHNYSTRQSNNIRLNLHYSNYSKNNIRYRSVNLWNSLNETQRIVTPIKRFKRSLRNSIISYY